MPILCLAIEFSTHITFISIIATELPTPVIVTRNAHARSGHDTETLVCGLSPFHIACAMNIRTTYGNIVQAVRRQALKLNSSSCVRRQ